MCGLAGLILGKRARRASALVMLRRTYCAMLVASQQRGRHAAGTVVLDRDGGMLLVKRPGPAVGLVASEIHQAAMKSVGEETVLVMGHTRYRTVGSEQDNNNNHPIRVGEAVITHNGTLNNHHALASRYRLRRTAEVDSEVLAHFADRSCRRRWDVDRLLRYCEKVEGRMTAVMASQNDPETVLVLKGNNPLTMRYNPFLDALVYASDESFLPALGEWRRFELPPMTAAIFHHGDIKGYETQDLNFDAQMRIGFCW